MTGTGVLGVTGTGVPCVTGTGVLGVTGTEVLWACAQSQQLAGLFAQQRSCSQNCHATDA